MRVAWPFDNPNHLGFLVGMVVPAMLVASAENDTWKRSVRIAINIVPAVFGALLASTGSRGAVVGVGLAVAFLILRRSHSIAAILSFVLGFVVGAVIFDGIDRHFVAVVDPWSDPSIRGRSVLWEFGMRVIADNHLGIGDSAFSVLFSDLGRAPTDHYGVRTAVNEYLTLAINYGIYIVGCVVFSIIFPLVVSESNTIAPWGRFRLALSASIISAAGACCFNTIHTIDSLLFFVASGWVSLLIVSLIHISWKTVFIAAAVSLMVSITITISLVVYSEIIASRSDISLRCNDHNGIMTTIIGPRGEAISRPRVMFVSDAVGALDEDEKGLLLAIVAQGFEVIHLRDRTGLGRVNSSEVVDRLPVFTPLRLYIGIGNSGKNALGNWANTSNIDCILISPRLTQQEIIQLLPSGRVLVIGGEPGVVQDSDAFAVQQARNRNKNIYFVAVNHETRIWDTVIRPFLHRDLPDAQP